ncbi:MAG: hypothetical protein K8S27_14155 [Candidatus Omnitrophica bacterium]|nr:hypothetical protein [Candidatus Omnitrophota bacterium]
MICRIAGKLVERREQSLVLDVNGLFYDIIVPLSVLQRINDTKDENGLVHLVTYHYIQIGPSKGLPVLIGFINEIEKDFFEHFIKVSGIGPKAAVKALNKPISEITEAIDQGNVKFLKTLSGIGNQKAKEIVAKLQGKIGKFGLIKDQQTSSASIQEQPDWQEEALSVLLQLQYKKQEAHDMISKALERSSHIHSAEDLLNEIYKQKVNG